MSGRMPARSSIRELAGTDHFCRRGNFFLPTLPLDYALESDFSFEKLPTMNEREIFTAAMQQSDVAARAAFLKQACGEDAALRERVHGLLVAHEQLGTFMDSSSSPDIVDPPI